MARDIDEDSGRPFIKVNHPAPGDVVGNPAHVVGNPATSPGTGPRSRERSRLESGTTAGP
jgi:hypothetical protein